MSSRERLRRGEPEVDAEPRPATPAPAPDVAAFLTLQRSVGNRALARLMYNPSNERLVVPDTYGNARAGDQTLAEKANSDATFRDQLRVGMHVRGLSQVTVETVANLRTHVAKLAADGNATGATAVALGDAAVDHNRLFKHSHGAKYASPDAVKTEWVMSTPGDFVPGKDDLPDANVNLFTQIKGEEKGKLYWEYACVLVALAKLDPNWTKAKALTKTNPSTIEQMVQDLHKYYKTKGVMYDDTSTRFRIMDEWGYKPIFFGKIKWKDLPKHVALDKGTKYIFDIVGHTVAVTATDAVPKDGSNLTDPKDSLETDSHPKNFKPGTEYGVDVVSIWRK